MSLRTPILTTSPEISAEAEALKARKAAIAVANAVFMRVTSENSQSLPVSSPSSYPKVVVQLVGAARNILVADHVDDLPVLDDVMTICEGRGKMEILLDQQAREALLLQPADHPADLLDDDRR